jgi:hypothetical protein
MSVYNDKQFPTKGEEPIPETSCTKYKLTSDNGQCPTDCGHLGCDAEWLCRWLLTLWRGTRRLHLQQSHSPTWEPEVSTVHHSRLTNRSSSHTSEKHRLCHLIQKYKRYTCSIGGDEIKSSTHSCLMHYMQVRYQLHYPTTVTYKNLY